MKTISDIQNEIDQLNLNQSKELEALKDDAFEVYETMDNINKVRSNLENMQGGEYGSNDFGELEYSVEVPSEMVDLPFITDYLTNDYGYITIKGSNDLRLAQSCGECITVNWNSSRNEHFVFDNEERKEIVKREDILEEGHPTISEETYISAKIALHQNEVGCFGDVVVIDYHGQYVKHYEFDKHLPDGIWSKETKDMIKDLKVIINEYEKELDNE